MMWPHRQGGTIDRWSEEGGPMHRVWLLVIATVAFGLGGYGLAVAQDATPQTNIAGTP